MDKRKIKKEVKGNATTTRNKFGSSYKHESIFTRTSEVLPPESERNNDLLDDHNKGYDPYALLQNFENRILDFCERNTLPTEPKDFQIKYGTKVYPARKHLWEILKKDNEHILGAYQAGDCLFTIHHCRQYYEKGDYENALKRALRLVEQFNLFTYSILEPTLTIGEHRVDKLLEANTKLDTAQERACFEYYESDELKTTSDGTRALNKSERWNKVSTYALNQFNVKIAADTLRKKYKKFIK